MRKVMLDNQSSSGLSVINKGTDLDCSAFKLKMTDRDMKCPDSLTKCINKYRSIHGRHTLIAGWSGLRHLDTTPPYR